MVLDWPFGKGKWQNSPDDLQRQQHKPKAKEAFSVHEQA